MGARHGHAGRRANRLSGELSPYLRQHAFNPVDWRPWGEGAFEEARRGDRPIFLSIGYSTCYWCHVMERECFESEAIARALNESFVPIKVDREELPQVDEAYMAALVASAGHGGWPMSVFLEPASLRPFFCGTYFPPARDPRVGDRPSFLELLSAIGAAWRERRSEVLRAAAELGEAARGASALPPARAVGLDAVRRAASALLAGFDRANGGFGRGQKFPQAPVLEFLLDVRERAGDDATRGAIDACVRATLDAMALGGLFDHAGGGFHRYCVDPRWAVPHFEKMLPDNALLAALYSRASRVYGDDFYAGVARRTLDALEGEWSLAGGGFTSAVDAEADGREGAGYVWTREAFEEAAGEDAALARRVYAIDAGPNFRDPHHPDEPASSVLRLAARPEELARREGVTPAELGARLEAINARLVAARGLGARPAVDDKAVASWNALAIAAFASAAGDLGEARYARRAIAGGEFLVREMARDGSLTRCWREGRTSGRASEEDHGAASAAMVALARLEPDGPRREAWIARAREFLDAGRRAASEDHGLYVRPRSLHDGAMPGGESLMIHAAMDLAEATGDGGFLAEALERLRALSGVIAESPLALIHATRLLLRALPMDAAGALARVGPGDEPATGAPERPAGSARTGLDARAGDGSDAGDGDPSPLLEVYASDERVVVGEGAPGVVTLRVRVREGLHVVAPDPGHAWGGLAAMRVGVEGGTGVAAYADYPAGREIEDGGPRVLDGEFELRVALEREGEWSGRPLLVLRYQACTKSECLAPARVELDVAIDPA